MKKTPLIIALFLLIGQHISAQEPLKNKHGVLVMPEAGELALGFDAAPFLRYAGNLFNGDNNSPNAELYIDEHRPAVVFDITVRPEDYVNGTNNHPTKSPLALALQRSLDGTSYRVERAGLKALIISRGIYQFAYFMPRRVWRKVSCLEFGDNPPSSPIKFTAEFEMIF